MRRIVAGALLGGLALFLWSFVAHLPPIGTMGLRKLGDADSAAVAAAMRGRLTERAIYFFPSAIVAFNPAPQASFGRFFAIELICDIVAALFGALIATSFAPSLDYTRRVLLLAAIGVLATVDIDASYWNWYAFPAPHLAGQFIDHAIGWLIAGLVLARICRPEPLTRPAATLSPQAGRGD